MWKDLSLALLKMIPMTSQRMDVTTWDKMAPRWPPAPVILPEARKDSSSPPLRLASLLTQLKLCFAPVKEMVSIRIKVQEEGLEWLPLGFHLNLFMKEQILLFLPPPQVHLGSWALF